MRDTASLEAAHDRLDELERRTRSHFEQEEKFQEEVREGMKYLRAFADKVLEYMRVDTEDTRG